MWWGRRVRQRCAVDIISLGVSSRSRVLALSDCSCQGSKNRNCTSTRTRLSRNPELVSCCRGKPTPTQVDAGPVWTERLRSWDRSWAVHESTHRTRDVSLAVHTRGERKRIRWRLLSTQNAHDPSFAHELISKTSFSRCFRAAQAVRIVERCSEFFRSHVWPEWVASRDNRFVQESYL